MDNNQPICVLFAGVVGASKTPIATYLSWNLGLPIFSNDAIRSEVHEDTMTEIFDDEQYLKRRNDRVERLLSSNRSFILDASIDRQWPTVKDKLIKSNYRWFIISLDLSYDFILKLYDAKGYTEKDRLPQLIIDHQEFVKRFKSDISLVIDDKIFPKRLEVSLESVSKIL